MLIFLILTFIPKYNFWLIFFLISEHQPCPDIPNTVVGKKCTSFSIQLINRKGIRSLPVWGETFSHEIKWLPLTHVHLGPSGSIYSHSRGYVCNIILWAQLLQLGSEKTFFSIWTISPVWFLDSEYSHCLNVNLHFLSKII